jgi:hypothetical protein
MSKWLSVCIFLLLAIACIVDVEPTEIVTPVAPMASSALDALDAPDAIVTPVNLATPAELVAPEVLAWEDRTNAPASLGAKRNMPRAIVTLGWSHAAVR